MNKDFKLLCCYDVGTYYSGSFVLNGLISAAYRGDRFIMAAISYSDVVGAGAGGTITIGIFMDMPGYGFYYFGRTLGGSDITIRGGDGATITTFSVFSLSCEADLLFLALII